MKKILIKLFVILFVVLIVIFIFLIPEGIQKNKQQEKANAVLSSSESLSSCYSSENETYEKTDAVLKVSENKQELIEETIEQNVSEEPIEEVRNLDFELPDDACIIEVYHDYNGNQKAITLDDGLLQIWLNETVVCEKQIPIPAKLSIGNGFYEIIGNPYISEDDNLVLIQSYTTVDGKQKLDYTILANNCNKIIFSLAYDGYVFQDYDGNYNFVFYSDSPRPWYPYAGFGFNDVDDNFTLPEPTMISLNESTVKSVNFGSWGSTSYGYRDINAISVRLDVESYGELDIAYVCRLHEPVEVDNHFFNLLNERFAPHEYKERYSKLIETINDYKRNN